MHPLQSMSPSTFTRPLITPTATLDKTTPKQNTNLSVSSPVATTDTSLSKSNHNINTHANVSLQATAPISTTIN